ncbi:hypothetical protein [Dactylosporangium matsuzakiense]|uniref:Uncharacterized protein n=1 Tax=Dactylosporangium matsuzakiense TaxID=53360 RepID=A0A9W6NNB7_9ACTN|nr:hypothetical protein [Dactylosporangium matsuzakiense]UWZ42726.1 hypothetical protein Dmats_35080 [Dactylosporangium matsuzakiense]GLL03790.1 hypothetical protein GCM10017581_055360 [Dactylosporangium matsuzakiense]
MNRLGWAAVTAAAVVLVCGGGPFAVGFPQRSSFLADQEQQACALFAQSSPYGQVSSCIDLGRRTPPLAGPGHVFLLVETVQGPAVVRLDYKGTDRQKFTATAVEVPTFESPGISHETSERLKTGMDSRGGIKSAPWTVYPVPG